jgi:hypothetical protein
MPTGAIAHQLPCCPATTVVLVTPKAVMYEVIVKSLAAVVLVPCMSNLWPGEVVPMPTFWAKPSLPININKKSNFIFIVIHLVFVNDGLAWLVGAMLRPHLFVVVLARPTTCFLNPTKPSLLFY